MTDVVVYAALAVGVVVCLLSVVGVLVARDAFDGMHFTGPASSVAPVAVALAVVVDQGPVTQAGVKATLTALLLVFLNGVVVHATARAVRVREHGKWHLLPEEREGEE